MDKIEVKGLIILISIVLFLSILFYNYEGEIEYDEFPEIKASDRILIFAPHPDDEALANSGIIKKAIQKNATVLVVLMTNGDAISNSIFRHYLSKTNSTNFKGNIGDMRHLETIKAMKALGLNQSNILFLCYPDGGLKAIFDNHWDYDRLFRSSRGSNQFDHSLYDFSYEKNAPYCGENVVKNLEKIMNDYKPTMIFYPDQGDEHTDHGATAAFVKYVSIKTNYKGKNYTYLVHKGPNWPDPPFYIPEANLIPPSELSALDANWMMLPLSEDEEDLKWTAVNSYLSQIFLMRNYLQSFIRENEIFAVYPTIKIEKIDNANFFEYGMPESSFKDVRLDPVTKNPLEAEDLTTLGFAHDEKNVYLILQTADNMDTKLVYKLHLRMYDGREFKRIDIKVKDGKAEYESKAKNSVKYSQTPLVKVKDNMMVVEIPISIFRGTKVLMMSADAFDSKNIKQLDRIAWRELEF